MTIRWPEYGSGGSRGLVTSCFPGFAGLNPVMPDDQLRERAERMAEPRLLDEELG